MSEVYNKGRTAGVEGTYGQKRAGLAEKTAVDNEEQSGDLAGVAGRIYQKAVANGGGKDSGGDPALRQR
ncbi:MAG: hypothetical protein ACREHV_14455 [Rhizomicrobium sp.]